MARHFRQKVGFWVSDEQPGLGACDQHSLGSVGNEEAHFLLLSSIYTAYCQVSAGRGSEERPAGFPPGAGKERLLQNGKFLEEV